MNNPTTEPRQSRRGTVYTSLSDGNLYLKVGPEGRTRHLFDLTVQDGRNIVAALREVLDGEDGADR